MGRIKRMRQTNRCALAAAMAAVVVVFSGCVMDPVDPDEDVIDPGEQVITDEPGVSEQAGPDEGEQDDPGKPGEPTPVPWVGSGEASRCGPR